MDELLLLDDLRPDPWICLGLQHDVVVVAFDGRRGAAVEERIDALREENAGALRARLRSLANEQELGDVPLRERALAAGDLDHCGTVS